MSEQVYSVPDSVADGSMNNHYTFVHFYFLIFVLLLLSFSGCSDTADQTTIRFWVFGAEGDIVEQLMPVFEQENPDIRVRIQKIPWTAAHEKLLTAYASNSTPDVFQLGNTWIPEFHMLNALEPINSRVDTSEVIDNGDYFEGIWATNVIEEMLFGVPWYVDTRVLFYRKDILRDAGFADPPRTWDELYVLSKTIKQSAGTEERYAMLLPTNEWVPPVLFGLQAGSSLLKEEGRFGNFSGNQFRTAFEYYARYFHEGLAPVGITQVTNIFQGLTEGFFAMYITGPWNVGEFRRRLPARMQDNWGTAPLPGPDNDTPGVSIAGGASLVMYRESRHKEEAWKLVEFFSRPDIQIRFNELSGNLPARISAWETSGIKDDPHIKAFYEQLPHVAPLPQVPEWEQIALKIQQYAEIVSMDRMTVADALTALDREVDRILDKRRWILSRTD
jgi:multiple sugar transport system substrate-binding protein